MSNTSKVIKRLKHHEQQDICGTRANFREGRRDTAVKVYTVNQESKYLLIQGVPAVGCGPELEDLCGQFGGVDELKPLDEYPTEKFTEVYYVKYCSLYEARFAKRKLDNRSFFGSAIHVCYAPEFETVQETREKLQDRRKVVAAKTKAPRYGESNDPTHHKPYVNTPRVPTQPSSDVVTYVWAGKTYTIPANSDAVAEQSLPGIGNAKETVVNNNNKPKAQLPPGSASSTSSSSSFIPRQLQKRKPPAAISSTCASSLDNTAMAVREKLKQVSEPVRPVTWKKRKT